MKLDKYSLTLLAKYSVQELKKKWWMLPHPSVSSPSGMNGIYLRKKPLIHETNEFTKKGQKTLQLFFRRENMILFKSMPKGYFSPILSNFPPPLGDFVLCVWAPVSLGGRRRRQNGFLPLPLLHHKLGLEEGRIP